MFSVQDDEDDNVCDAGPCENGAQCEATDEGYHCTCVLGYEGKNCEIGTESLSATYLNIVLFETLISLFNTTEQLFQKLTPAIAIHVVIMEPVLPMEKVTFAGVQNRLLETIAR